MRTKKGEGEGHTRVCLNLWVWRIGTKIKKLSPWLALVSESSCSDRLRTAETFLPIDVLTQVNAGLNQQQS